MGLDAFCALVAASGPALSRPFGDRARMQAMLDHADVVMTAREALAQTTAGVGPGKGDGAEGSAGGRLLGVARVVTDFVWAAYVIDIAVDRAAQGRGIGTGLMHGLRRELGPQVSIVLVSLPDATGFYERLGMARVEGAFWWLREG